MNVSRLISALLCMTLAVLSTESAVSASEKAEKIAGKTYFTAANIRYDKPGRIDSTNFIWDTFIPVGTEVTIKEVNDKETFDVTSNAIQEEHAIRFVDKGGVVYKMVFVKKTAAPQQTVLTLFERYFSAEDPLAPGGQFSALSPAEQANVKKGVIASGMSRKAVLMAYGYPPGRSTPSLESNIWRYWLNRRKSITVKFENDAVVLPEGEKTGRERAVEERTVEEKSVEEKSVEERLQKIETLKKKGLITEKEYEKKRSEILKDL